MSRYEASEATVNVWCGDVIAVTWRSGAYFVEILRTFRAAFPSARYDGDHKEWLLDRSWATPLNAWLQQYFEAQAIAWQEESPTPSDASYIADAYAALHLTTDAPTWAVEAIYKAAMKVHHPDHGGNHDEAVRVNAAIDTIRAYNARRN